MTKKRFNYHIDEVGIYYYVCDNTKKGDDRIILEFNTKFDAIEVCNLLNSLNNENEQLKIFLEALKEELSLANRDNDALEKENEQLKQQLQEEQCRTTPITLTTHISDDDFKKIELMLKKYFEDLE